MSPALMSISLLNFNLIGWRSQLDLVLKIFRRFGMAFSLSALQFMYWYVKRCADTTTKKSLTPQVCHLSDKDGIHVCLCATTLATKTTLWPLSLVIILPSATLRIILICVILRARLLYFKKFKNASLLSMTKFSTSGCIGSSSHLLYT